MDIEEFKKLGIVGTDAGTKRELINYLNYLDKRMLESSEFFRHIIGEVEKVDFDEENGSELVKSADEISKSMNDVVGNFESLARATNDLYEKKVQRDVKINKILKK